MPTEQLDVQRILVMDADNRWDGVSERLKLRLAGLTIELCYSFFSVKFSLKVSYRIWTQQDV